MVDIFDMPDIPRNSAGDIPVAVSTQMEQTLEKAGMPEADKSEADKSEADKSVADMSKEGTWEAHEVLLAGRL